MVEEGELVIARQRREPQRQFGEIGRERVSIYAIEAPPGDQSFRVKQLVLIRRDASWRSVMMFPCLDQTIPKRATGLDEKRARAHGGVENLEVEQLVGPRLCPQPKENGLERVPHNWLRQLPRGIVRARPATLVSWLQERCTRGQKLRRSSVILLLEKGLPELVRACCRFDGVGDRARVFAASLP